MKRKITRAEENYHRVKGFLKAIPSDIHASLRNELMKPSFVDPIRKRIREGWSMTIDNDKWQYSFLHGEKELDELIKQII